MVQRLAEEPHQENSGLSWQGLHFPQAPGKIGDVLLQFTHGEIKSLAFQQRRGYEPSHGEDLNNLQGCKRSRLLEAGDISFRGTRNGSHTVGASIDGRPLQMLTRTFALSTTPSLHPLEEPSPLGLTLRKTPSFLDLVAMTVGQTCNNGELMLTDGAAQGVASRPGLPTQGKLKASNFSASTLKIGSWERVSKHEGDVVAKCYFAKRKLVWEVLENGLKSKIELQWSDISAIRGSYGDGQVGILEVEVSRPPLFFKETNPQPRKHTLWEATSDFTGGEATICKKHALQFPEGVLNKHYEKLLQCDSRLRSLAGDASLGGSPQEQSSFRQELERRHQQQQPMCLGKTEVSFSPLGNRCSPSSVMESRGSDDSDGEDGQDTGLSNNNSSQALVIQETMIPEEQKPHRGLVLFTGDLSTSDKDVLNEIAQILLGSDSNVAKASPERSGLNVRVSSMSGFQGGPWPPSAYAVSDWNFAGCGTHGNEGYGANEEENKRNSQGEEDVDSRVNSRKERSMEKNNDSFDSSSSIQDFNSRGGINDFNSSGSENNEMSHSSLIDKERISRNSSNSSSSIFELEEKKPKLTMEKNASTGDLLVNLPRIASLPQLFESL